VIENETASMPDNPTKEGYTFGGWYTEVNGGGTEFTADTEVTENITVYAKWNSYLYEVTFDSQDATTNADPTSKSGISPDTTVDVLPTAPEKTGYTFGGWFTEVNGGGTEFTSSTVVTGDITVYAEWHYVIGDVGPAGGYIFYDKGSYSDGWRYLEAAPASNEEFTTWGENVTVGTDTAIGSGANNTVIIVKKLGESAYAAKYCADLVVTKEEVEYDDWFLPSRGEINYIYLNLASKNLGGFSHMQAYWSSSENIGYNVWSQYSFSVGQYPCNRDSQLWVRPVRAF
jgi:uncharacterized repeat protein (TIGR02543 family)